MATYEAAKARIWSHQRPTDAAIGIADDPVVMRHLARARPARRHVRRRPAPTTALERRRLLVGPAGPLADGRGDDAARCPTTSPTRSPPRRSCSSPGSPTPTPSRAALATFAGPPHRIELVGEADGVRWYNDSKATTPHAALTAIRGFDRVVLIAGGRNKGLDLRRLAAEPERIRGVVAHRRGRRRGRRRLRRPWCPVRVAASMAEAVDARRRRWPSPATSCCCRRPAPASTGTPTAATRRAATTSSALVRDDSRPAAAHARPRRTTTGER